MANHLAANSAPQPQLLAGYIARGRFEASPKAHFNMNRCLAQYEIEQFIRGQGPEAEQFTANAHLEGCGECRRRVAEERLFLDVQQFYRAPICDDATSPGEADQITLADGPIAGYRILNEIHRGGQGIVYKAVQRATRRVVALKVVLGGAFATEQQRGRFEREIDVVASLKHPNIVTMFDSGVSRKRHYFAMEYVDGKPLDKFLHDQPHAAAGNRDSWQTVARERLTMFLKICEAVSHAHRRTVIHRDLKPGNVMIDGDGVPHVLDFGLAKFEAANMTNEPCGFHTQDGEFLGTLAYASPEQAAGDTSQIDIRSDVYSLGVMLYELITGELPYDVRGDLTQTLQNIREANPLAPSTVDPRIDHELETIMYMALAKEPSRRYQSADHLARDVGHYLAGEAIDAKRDSVWYLLRKSLRRYRMAVAIALAFLAIVVTSLFVSLTFWRRAVIDRNLAIVAGRQAVAAQHDAELQRLQAVAQRREADRQRDEAEFQAYAANIAAADGALQRFDVADARLRLNLAPAARRNWEWFQLDRQLDSSVLTLDGHTSYVERVCVLRDRGWLISTGWDKTVRIWDLADGHPIASFEIPAPAWSLDVSPDGEWFAVGDWRHTVRVWNVDRLKLEFEYKGPARRVPAVAFSPDGTELVASFWAFDDDEPAAANVIHFIDLQHHQVARTLPQRSYVSRLAFTPDGGSLITVDDRGTSVWDTTSASRVRELPGKFLALSDDGQRFVSVLDGEVAAVCAIDGTAPPVVLPGAGGAVLDAAFDRTGTRVVTGARDKTVRIWDATTGSQVGSCLGHTWTVTSVAFAKNGERIVSGSWDHSIKVWDANAGELLTVNAAHQESITDLTFSPTGEQLATASRDGTIKIWHFASRALIETLRGHEQAVQAVAFSPSGTRVASASWDQTVKLWDLAAPTTPITLSGHTDLVLGVAFHPDGQWLVSSSRDNTLRIWDAEQGDAMAVLHGHTDHAHNVVFSPDGRYFASCGHVSVKLWDSATKQEIASSPRNTIQEDYALAFDPAGRTLVAGTDSTSVRFWDIDGWQVTDTVQAHSDEIYHLCFHPDGSRMVSTSNDGTTKIWDMEHRIPLSTLRGHVGKVGRVAFSPDGRSLVGGMIDGRVVVWRGQ